MLNLVSTFSKVREVMLASCAGTLAAENACFQLTKHHRIVGCQIKFWRFVDGPPSLVEVYPKHVSSLKFVKTSSKVTAAVKKCL